MRAFAPSVGTAPPRWHTPRSGFTLRANAREHFMQRTAQAMQLIDEIEDHRNAFVVHSDVREVPDQSCACNIDIEELFRLAVRPQPSGLDPGGHHSNIDPSSREKFARFHAHPPVASRSLSAATGCH